MLNLPVHGPTRPGSAPSSGTWTPRTARPATVTTYLLSHRRTTGRRLPARPRHQPEGGHLADLEAFLADLLARQTASTAGAYHKILYGWLAEEKEIPTNPIMPADSSPARANILVPPVRTSWCPREDLNLRSPASQDGALSLSYKGKELGLVERAGANLRRRHCQRRACRLSYVPVWLV